MHRALFTLVAMLVCPVAQSDEIAYLRKNETFCDATGDVCLRGTISYRVNSRLLALRSRVQQAPGPGLLRISVSGENRQGHLRRAAIEVTIRGRASEIVNKEIVPDTPDVYEWHLESITFDPGVESPPD